MECTQRLECTHQEFMHQTEREYPEQIGFLGICGNKYPVKKGPNKIGRDPQTCNIVLNLNSVSRQHAVINILNKTEFMLMDLDSANKTKLLGKTLLPYMPQPLKNGDMVQFGEVFGIFRLLEEPDELPMTQAMLMTQPINIPDTPIPTRHISKLNSATTIPESPDVSDKDDSFIIASQPKGHQLKTSNKHHFIKPGKTISIQPIGGHKIDNIYWNSSKKSTSLNLDDSDSSLNDSTLLRQLSDKENEANANIHEMETQAFPLIEKDSIHEMNTQVFPLKIKETDSIYEANTQQPESPIPDSIYTANTQLPGFISTSAPSIYTANTQLSGSSNTSLSIHTADTQIPLGEKLPEVCKINEQQDMQFDLCADKDNAETGMLSGNPKRTQRYSPSSRKCNDNPKLVRANDIVLFDEIDERSEDENLESQAICTDDILLPINKYVETESEPLSQIALPKSSKRNMRIQSDSSTDCEEIDDDIFPTQKSPATKRKGNDGDTTDCEDEMIELKIDKKADNTAEALDLEDVATQVIEVLETSSTDNADFGDVLTQVIDVVEIVGDSEKLDFENVQTQVLIEDDLPTKRSVPARPISDEVEISPFKIPLSSALRTKRKDVSKTLKIKDIESKSTVQNDDKYYQDTQDIYEDLCSQREFAPEVRDSPKRSLGNPSKGNKLSPYNNRSDTSLNNDKVEENINNFLSTMSSQDIRDVIGGENVAPMKRVSSLGSDTSDPELTPKKKWPFKFMDIDLPSSQEIKNTVSLNSKSMMTESSSDSETEQNSENQCTPIVFRKKNKSKRNAKIDLTKIFDVETLPTRVITRVRKPTFKVHDLDGKIKTESILKPKFLTDQDADVDGEIIIENITRLKSENEKLKNSKETSKITNTEENKKQDVTVNEIKKLDVNNTDQNKKIHDEKKEIEIKNKLQTQKESKKLIKTKHNKSESDAVQKRESKRNKRLSSPVDNRNVIDNKVIDKTEKTNATSKTAKSIDISTTESKPSTKTPASKLKEDKPRGPIMIEPHTISVPIKEDKPKKREYKRKNKDTITQAEKLNIEVQSVDLSESKRSVRITRGRKKQSDNFVDPTKLDLDTEKKLKQTKLSKEASPEKEIRRSKRQRVVKKTEEPKVIEMKSILKKSSIREQSTIYDQSSGSNSDTPKNLKRPSEFEDPVPKRTRSGINNASLRATSSRTRKTCYVLFTAFPYEEVKSKLEKLGAVIVTDVTQCTVVLTQHIKRTFKLLCAVGLGKPIVGPNWVQACSDTNIIVDPWLYTMKDEAAEKKFHFSLERTLIGKRNFLKGYNLSSTPSVIPESSEMKLIVQCSGGSWQEGGPRWICLTGSADRALWPDLKKRGAILVTTELILGGVLRQQLDIERNRIKIQY